jgi:hypothetical protein
MRWCRVLPLLIDPQHDKLKRNASKKHKIRKSSKHQAKEFFALKTF